MDLSRRDLLIGGLAAKVSAHARFASRNELQSAAVADGVQSIELNGFKTPGDQGRGAIYVRGDKDGLLAIQDGSGQWWQLVPGASVWAGWFGVLGVDDDTIAMQTAITWIARAKGRGTLNIAEGRYRIAATAGSTPIGAHDDGTHPDPAVVPLAPTQPHSQAYCLKLPSGVSLKGHGNVWFEGEYSFGRAGSSEAIGIAIDGVNATATVVIEGISFAQYFIAVGSIARQTLVSARFYQLTFQACAVGIYALTLERCVLDQISAQGVGCVVAVGGQWATRHDDYNEAGGFADKCVFGVLHNIYGRALGDEEAAIDRYFDEAFFMTGNNQSRLVPGRNRSLSRMFPYLGLCGRAIYIMARHGRPSNANMFQLVSHAYAPRAAVWIDHAIACRGDIVYLESCGYIDSRNRRLPIGPVGVDPYLGAGRRVPAFIKGFDAVVDGQFIVCSEVIASPGSEPIRLFGSDVRRSPI